MDGRFPFDAAGGPPQFHSAAQVRAALGLPPMDESLYIQRAQQQRAAEQCQLQFRQIFLREQAQQQQLQEQQLRAIGDQLNEFPDLQQHYQSLLINEQLQRQRTGSITNTNGLSAVSNLTSQAQPVANAALLRDQVALRDLRAYEEVLLRQQQRQLQLQQQQQLTSNNFNEELNQAPRDPSPASMLISALNGQQQPHKQQQLTQAKPPFLQGDLLSQNIANFGVNQAVSAASMTNSTHQVISDGSRLNRRRVPNQEGSERSTSDNHRENEFMEEPLPKKKRKYTKRKKNMMACAVAQGLPTTMRTSPISSNESEFIYQERMNSNNAEHNALEDFAFTAANMNAESDKDKIKGSINRILEASEDVVQLEGAAGVLVTLLSQDKSLTNLGEGVAGSGLVLSNESAESVSTRHFSSYIPCLPEEPLFVDRDVNAPVKSPDDDLVQSKYASMIYFDRLHNADSVEVTQKSQPKLTDYTHPIDTWWPSIHSVRKERRSMGEDSDEDNFLESSSSNETVYRANEIKIKNSLTRLKEPGVLEKLPHCRIHRARLSNNSTVPELVYCHQVTEIYPQAIMCCCSKCGTWRHAACGGHFEPYSARENAKTPFVAICDFCHEEEKFLKASPQGKSRVERQRMENVRRGLATSAVLRHLSYSKHGGTYKWPLGSVSATHIGGHTRSVHVRHDKAGKQWTDMATRLGRGHGYRVKERVRSRTKEFERLLVSIEDAESFTDRHNMLLFLLRDTAKSKPTGFEKEIRNIFDPADDGMDQDVKNIVTVEVDPSNVDLSENPTMTESHRELCVRPECLKCRRFDSLFCSDACGVVVLEMDLIRTLHDAQDIHPSVLRH